MATEEDLYDLKWFDYRHLSPDECTRLFILFWVQPKRYHLIFLDTFKGPSVNFLGNWESFELPYLRTRRDWSSYNKLRVWADKSRMPYDLFWKLAFATLRKLGWGRQFPNVFLNSRLLKGVTVAWEDYQEGSFVKARAPHLQGKAYQGTEIQNDYQHYLVNTMKKRTRTSRWPARAASMIEAGTLSGRFVQVHYPDLLPAGDR